MHIQEWLRLLSAQIKETSILQWMAVATGVAEVLLARINNVWLYPAGIVSTILSVYLLFEVQLYAESLLNVYYIIMSFYGWIYWSRRRNEPPVPVTWSGRKDWLITGIIVGGGGVFLYYVLRHFTPSTVPGWDAWVAATGWAGMWLLARRKIENWILLNLSNIVAIPLLVYKKLPLFAGLTLFLFIVAIIGFFDWRRIYNQRQFRMTNPENAIPAAPL